MKSLLLLCFISLLTLTSCEDKSVYSYIEIHRQPETPMVAQVRSDKSMPAMGKVSDDPQVNAMLKRSVAAGDITWELPAGWREEAGSGMRIATLYGPQNYPVETSIISLAGQAGGEEANIARWISQLNTGGTDMPGPSDVLAKAETVPTASGEQAKIIDLTQITGPNTDSIIGAVIQTPKRSVFIKMTGTTADLNSTKEPFLNFVTSLTLAE